MPEKIVKDLSTDQKYLYKIIKIIRTGNVNPRAVKQKIGPVDHSRWLTTANRFCRLYISNHELGEKDRDNLVKIVSFIVYHYGKMWFQIKCRNKLSDGPHNALKNVQILNKCAPKDVMDIVKPVIQRGSWHAHSENILYSLLTSHDPEDRKFAVKQILKIRKDNVFGDSSVRAFHVPTINWNCENLYDLIDWSDVKYEPIMTCELSRNDLQDIIDGESPVNISITAPCHTQSCERAVKEVTKACDKFSSHSKRHYSILAKLESRKFVKKPDSKKYLQSMLNASVH